MRELKVLVTATLTAALAGALLLAGCGNKVEEVDYSAADPVEVQVASLKGPTSIGLVSMMDKAQAEGEEGLYNDFNFQVCGTADEILPNLIKGDIDIACIPANAASVVYNKTQGGIVCLDINTLGVLYVVAADEGIASLEDLAGHTVYMTGKGTTPQYAMEYLLEKAGVADQVTLEYKSEATELAALLVQDPEAIAVLPQPYVTAVCTKNPELQPRVSLADVWEQVSDDGSQLVTGVTVVRKAFLEENPLAVAEFMAEQAASVEAVNNDPDAAGPLVVAAGIMESPEMAAKAIPGCNLVFIAGDDLKAALSGYLQVLFDQNPESVGGALPADDFYYLPE